MTEDKKFTEELEKKISDTIDTFSFCQRNWDLDKKIPERHIELIERAVTQCSSKNSQIFYTPVIITNRELIEKIHVWTNGYNMNRDEVQNEADKDLPPMETSQMGYTTNSQTLAQVLIVFLEDDQWEQNYQYTAKTVNPMGQIDGWKNIPNFKHPNRDLLLSTGVAVQSAVYTANLLGYKTGICTCFDNKKIQETMEIKEAKKTVLCLLGIGVPDITKLRTEHHVNGWHFPTWSGDKKDHMKAIRID
jgi:hypothetical protein